MRVFDYFSNSNLDFSDYVPKKGKYDEVFAAVSEYLFRASKFGIDLTQLQQGGVSEQEVVFNDKSCERLFLLFVYLNSNAYNPVYISECLEVEYLELSSKGFSENLFVLFKVLSYVQRNLSQGYKKVLKNIASISSDFCSESIYNLCIERYHSL